jgi:hypothetical protein
MVVEFCSGYEPHPQQSDLHRTHTRFLAAAAGVRGGKTLSGGAEFVRRIHHDSHAGKGFPTGGGGGRKRRPRLHYWVVAPTYDLLKEPQRVLFDMLPREWVERYYADDNTLWLKGDILIEFKGADRPQNLVSVGLHGIWIDEAARIKPDAWRGQLRQRLTDKNGWALFTTTPLGRNWFFDDVVSPARDGQDQFGAVEWVTADNPYIPREEIESARAQLPYRYFAREYLASFDSFTGAVFDEWREDLHVVTEESFRRQIGTNGTDLRSLFRKVAAGVDWGWNDPGCIIVVGDMGGRWLVLEESYAPARIMFDPRLGAGTWVAEAMRLREKWGISGFWVDPSRPDARNDFLRSGLPTFLADNEIAFGIRKVAEALHPCDHLGGLPRLQVMADCENLRREIRNYQWGLTKTGETFTDVPADGQSDHAIDALRYAMAELMRFEELQRPKSKNPYLQTPLRGPVM